MSPSGDPLTLEPVTSDDRERLDDVAVAVIGCGVHSSTAILPALRHAGIRLVAVCDLDLERAESARRRFGAQFVYGSVDDLLARGDLDAVIVVGPPELHVSAGVAALDSGRHVFVEKPPGTSLDGALALQRAAQVAERQAMVGFMKRRASAYRLLRQIVESDEFGAVTSVDMTYAHWPVAGLRSHLIDMSVHAFDTVRWLLGEPLRMAAFKRPIDGNHALALMIEHAGGAVSRLDLSAFAPGLQERLAATGRDATVWVENLAELTYVRQREGMVPDRPNNRLVRSWRPELSLPDPENDSGVLQGYVPELIAFADAIRTGAAATPSIDDGVAAMRLVEALIEAPEGLSVTDFE
jgi:myo-inositol 2-dehydrogenase / D-chiro-inositol 1-dehydrogenase